MQGAVSRAGMEGAVRKSRNGGSSKECQRKCREQWGRAGMEGAVGKSRNGRSSEEERDWKERWGKQEWKEQWGRAGMEGAVSNSSEMQGAVSRAGMEGDVRKSRNGGSIKELQQNAGSCEEEQVWKEQWGREGVEGAVRKSRYGRSSEEEQEWKEQ
jgi:hypothetical protein